MALVVSPSLQDVYTKLKELIFSVVPISNDLIVQGLGNRVAMPKDSPGFVCMTATRMHPHRTPEAAWNHDDPNPNAITLEQGMLVRIQIDCFSPSSADWAVMLATVLRNDFGCRALAPFAPLFADDPLQAALTNSEEQYEERWIVGANLQYNPVVSTPMQFANTLEASLINVDVRFPP